MTERESRQGAAVVGVESQGVASDGGRAGAAARRLRVGVRRTRQTVRGWQPVPGWDAPLTAPLPRGRTLELRPPRLSDGPAWRAQRLASRSRLEPWWPVDGDWDQAQSLLAWTEWCVPLRAAARRGLAHPFVLLVDGRLVGQVGVDAVDLGTGTGEFSAWVNTRESGAGAGQLAAVLVALRAFTSARPLDRLVAPVSVDNPNPVASLRRIGFEREATLHAYRETAAGRTDHDIWVLHRTPSVVQALLTASAPRSSSHVG